VPAAADAADPIPTRAKEADGCPETGPGRTNLFDRPEFRLVTYRDALADRLARLVVAGHLRHCDPAQAAEQFLALLTGPFERRSRLGTRPLPAAEVDEVADQAADTFLRAFGA
jgi:hypothetical protein